MKRPPTDLEILEEIYSRYYEVFASYSHENPNRQTKVYVPIDIRIIAKHFGVDADIVHGRLYYYLDHKYEIVRSDGIRVPFFRFVEGEDRNDPHQVQFPMLASAIADLRERRNQYLWAIGLAAASFIVALIAFIISVRC